MRLGIIATALAAGIVGLSQHVAEAQEKPPIETPLTMVEVLALVRERGPEVQVARARVAEAEARVAAAGIRLQENPRLEVAAGPRTGGSTEWDLGFEQPFDAPGSRGARMEAARAALEREQAVAAAVTRTLLREAAVAFVTVLQRDREIDLLQAAQSATGEVLRAAERRYAVGDIAILDVNVARAADARARSDLRSATAARLAAAGTLAAVLGLSPSGIRIAGDLRPAPPPTLDQLRAALAQRPEFQALAAERREAVADIRLGESQRKPRFGARVGYQREEGDHIVLGGLTVSLPAFNTGQDLRLVGVARARRVDLELTAARVASEARVEAAAAGLAEALSAVEALEQDALAQTEESDSLARRSYEAGQISLADWLILRRESLDLRRAYVEKLRDAAVARIELEAIAGVLR
jgi:cobalt-zinc-cadmium efflux system outer membrane protein